MRLPFPPGCVIAHRGSAAPGALENTMASFERAIARGAHGIEVDVREIAGGDLVVFHDADVEGLPLRTLTFEALSRAVPDRIIPSLAEVAEALARRTILDIELKDRGIEWPALATLVAAGWSAAGFVVTSFDIESLDDVRRMQPQLATGWLTDSEPLRAIDYVTSGRVDFAALHDRTLTADALLACERAAVPVVAWTVNEPSRIASLFTSPCVRAVITDCVPELTASESGSSR